MFPSGTLHNSLDFQRLLYKVSFFFIKLLSVYFGFPPFAEWFKTLLLQIQIFVQLIAKFFKIPAESWRKALRNIDLQKSRKKT